MNSISAELHRCSVNVKKWFSVNLQSHHHSFFSFQPTNAQLKRSSCKQHWTVQTANLPNTFVFDCNSAKRSSVYELVFLKQCADQKKTWVLKVLCRLPTPEVTRNATVKAKVHLPSRHSQSPRNFYVIMFPPIASPCDIQHTQPTILWYALIVSFWSFYSGQFTLSTKLIETYFESVEGNKRR